MDPPLIVRPTAGSEFVDHAKALQTLVNIKKDNEWGLRQAADHTILSDVKMGTGFYYIPFEETVMKTAVAKITKRAPRIRTHRIEDVVVPGGSTDCQDGEWIAMRHWLSPSELRLYGKMRGWDIESSAVTSMSERTKTQRERFGLTSPQ